MRASHRRSGLVLLVAAMLFVVLRAIGVPFDATPLMVGLALLAAAAAGPAPRSWAGGAVVTAWGVGVLLRRSEVVPGPEAAVFLFAAGVGLLAAALLTRPERARSAFVGAALAVVAGGLLFLAVPRVPALTAAWPWAVGLGVAGVVELARPEEPR